MGSQHDRQCDFQQSTCFADDAMFLSDDMERFLKICPDYISL